MKIITNYYKNILPEVEDFVYGKVIEINDYGINIELEEYNDQEAYLSYKDASQKKWLKSIKKQLKIGKQYVFHVTSVNEEKNFINLTKKYQTKDEEEDFLDFYRKYKNCISIFKNFLIKKDCFDNDKHIDYANKILWKFDKNELFNEFTKIKRDNNLIKNLDLDTNDQKILLECIKNQIKDIEFIVRFHIKIISQNTYGIKDIKDCLSKIESKFNNKPYINAIPIYTLEFKNVNENNLDKVKNDVKDYFSKTKHNTTLYVNLDDNIETYEM